jgi:membrane fusion protein (multidrug efflux system)
MTDAAGGCVHTRGCFAGLLVVALAGSGCGGSDRAEAAPPESARDTEPLALPVVGAEARRGDLVLTVRTTARVRAERLVNIRAETQGTVTEVTVRPGGRADSGQVLVRFDPRPFDLAVREAEAGLDDARVRLNDLMLGDSSREGEAAYRTRYDNARIRAGIAVAEARLERARLERERAAVTAPFAGVIDELGVAPGQRVGAGELLARLVDLRGLIVEASVLEHDLPLLRPGGQARVTASASGGSVLEGVIVAVLPVVDSTTRAGRVLVRVRSGGELRPGMYADVELESERLRGRVLVPAGAVIERDGRPLVFRARGGRAEWVYVIAGRSNGRETEIRPDSSTHLPAVAPGDTVLTSGHVTITHDAIVRVSIQR